MDTEKPKITKWEYGTVANGQVTLTIYATDNQAVKTVIAKTSTSNQSYGNWKNITANLNSAKTAYVAVIKASDFGVYDVYFRSRISVTDNAGNETTLNLDGNEKYIPNPKIILADDGKVVAGSWVRVNTSSSQYTSYSAGSSLPMIFGTVNSSATTQVIGCKFNPSGKTTLQLTFTTLTAEAAGSSYPQATVDVTQGSTWSGFGTSANLMNSSTTHKLHYAGAYYNSGGTVNLTGDWGSSTTWYVQIKVYSQAVVRVKAAYLI